MKTAACLVLAIFAIAFAACGGGDGDGNDDCAAYCAVFFSGGAGCQDYVDDFMNSVENCTDGCAQIPADYAHALRVCYEAQGCVDENDTTATEQLDACICSNYPCEE